MLKLVLVLAITVYFIRCLLRPEDWQSKRRDELSKFAKRLNLRFKPDSDFQLAHQFRFLNQLRQGDTHYGFNVISGDFADHAIVAFDYHFCTSSENRGRVNIQHFHLSVLTLKMKGNFPEITIAREGWKSRLVEKLGRADIAFESAEFSRSFCVRSKDKRFAYDVCNAQMMEFLLANRDLNIEIEGGTLALVFENQLPATQIETNLQRLLEIRSRLPEYLFTRV